MAYVDQKRNRTVAIGSVVLVHAALGAALLSGLAVKFAPSPEDRLEGEIIELAPPPPVDEPPPPRPAEKVVETKANPSERIVAPDTPTFTTSEVTLDTTTVVTPPSRPDLPAIEAEPAPPPAPPVNLASAARIRGDQGAWFPQDAYPAAARRAGAEGRVGVSVDIGASGRVTACRVLISSGNDDLDAATCRLATRNGRFEPAKDAAGNKVGSTLTLRPVRWRLEE